MSLVICVSVFAGCTSRAGDTPQPSADVSTQEKTEEVVENTESSPAVTENADEAKSDEESENNPTEKDIDEAFEETMDQIEAIGDVDVDKGLFDVTLTIPEKFIGETTQEELDETVKEKGYKSAVLNEDGSVTYVMSKAQHREMMDGVTKTINDALDEMVGSDDYPSITEAKANNDFTKFTITTKNTDLSISESLSALALYMYGGMYAIFNGKSVDNIHVDFINADTGEIISSSDSDNLGD